MHIKPDPGKSKSTGISVQIDTVVYVTLKEEMLQTLVNLLDLTGDMAGI